MQRFRYLAILTAACFMVAASSSNAYAACDVQKKAMTRICHKRGKAAHIACKRLTKAYRKCKARY